MPASSTLMSNPATADRPAAAVWWKALPGDRWGLVAFAAAACLVGLGFSLYTQQIWEDALITLRHSENLTNGQGLVYNPGERVHGFTSPINVLLLTLCHLLTGQTSYTATLWLYRLFTIAAFASGGVFVLRAMTNVAPRWTPALWFLAILYMFEPKSVAYSSNGMETGFMMLFVGWAIYLLTTGPADRWLARGLCWAGLMWTRPDGCVYIVALALAELLFFQERPRRETIRSLAKSAGLCALLYGPWFLWAWWYYGSPIPQTVFAKANVEQGTLAQILSTLERLPELLFFIGARALRPIQFPGADTWMMPAGWAHLVYLVSKLLSGFALVYWLFPVQDRLDAASFCFALLCGYFSFHMIPYLWYYPPAAVFVIVAVARGLTMLVVGIRELGRQSEIHHFGRPSGWRL